MVSMHKSQRTGVRTCVTIRFSTARPSWTTWPSRLEMTAVRGSWVETERAREASRSTAGAMCVVWNAPATLNGINRALAGGSSANAAIGAVESLRDKTSVTAPYGGTIVEWLVQDGDLVSPGQPLVRLHPEGAV